MDRHTLVEVLNACDELALMVEHAPVADGEHEKGFDCGFLEAMDQVRDVVLEMIGEGA